MRIRGAAVSIFLACVIAVSLGGCAPAPPAATSSPRATFAPVFAADAEALAAAKKAYAGYLAVADAVGADGGAHPERLKSAVTAAEYKREINGYVQLQHNRRSIVGTSKFVHFELQRVDETRGQATIVAYVCLDLRETQLVDANGVAIDGQANTELLPLEVSFLAKGPRAEDVLVEGNKPWSGQDFC